MMRQSTYSERLQMIQNWEEQFMHQIVILPFKRILTDLRNRLNRNLMKVKKKEKCKEIIRLFA